jgi:putative flavoprotein involved in K+ transport
MSTEQTLASSRMDESFDTIVIGGGQAGLAAGYFLARQHENFMILDENPRTGDSWRKRWDSLRLFTPSKFNNLPGSRFPRPADYLPTKNEAADYLEGYAQQFNLPVRHKVRVNHLSRNGNGYHISTGDSNLSARNVIVATGPFQAPYTPPIAGELDASTLQLHSSEYCNSSSIPAESVLVVGAGNSGAEIALELVRAGKRVWLAGRDVGRIPANGPLGKVFGGHLIWWFMNHVLTVNTPIGRKVRASESHRGTPLGRARRDELAKAGIELVPRISGMQAGKPQLEDGRVMDVEGVLWATGFLPSYDWIDLPILGEDGYPKHSRGIVQDAPGLYFLGLMFQTALSSSLLGGVSTDAAYIVGQVRGG